MPAIQVKKLRKVFPTKQKDTKDLVAVNDVEFSVEKNEIFGFLGPNGAGKTTTISMLIGSLLPTGGTADIFGLDLNKQMRKIQQVSGLAPQDIALYPALSGLSNLQFFGGLYGLTGQQLKKRIAEVLEIVGLAGREKDLIKNYSGGMKRRLNLAAGLLHRPKILYLDEPTVGVDPQSRNKIFESVKHLLQEYDMTIIYTSHNMEEVQMLCNRVAIIDRGKIIALDTVDNLIAQVEGHLSIGLSGKLTDAQQQIDQVNGVKKISQKKNVLKIDTTQVSKALPEILKIIDKMDTDLTSIKILEPNLESVFLKLTGRQLRD